MSKSINLILGCHSHQPVGNFDHVFEDAFNRAYGPFVDVLQRFPAVKVTLHYSGPLLDWLADNRPEYLERLAGLVHQGQVEIMGGGYYEPLLCAIPERDAIAQIERMATFCDKHFGQRPKGMWLTERVYEPQMPRTLARAGIEYTALDDAHFFYSGLSREDLYGYYLTEDEGYCVKVFPILEPLRYAIPFHPVQETLDYLRERATEEGDRCAVIHDDGEKFGVWPGTYGSVYEEGWLETFFQALTDNQDWLRSVTYSEYIDQHEPRGRTYITCASYDEMMEWALPTPMQRRLHKVKEEIRENQERAAEHLSFVRGGFWRSFLAKYEESNNIQKRMLRVSDRLQRMRRKKDGRLDKAEKLLHQGQCNCAYWHGVFGGLYLNHLRTALYEKLIEADRILDSVQRKSDNWATCDVVDFDADGRDEVLLENSSLFLGLSGHDGGTLFEWDYKDHPFNFGNVLTRREEPYHDELRAGRAAVEAQEAAGQSIHEMSRAKENGLDKFLIYDSCRRVSLRDHFLPLDTEVEELRTAQARECGDFAAGRYEMEQFGSKARPRIQFRRKGTVWAPDACAVEICKSIELPARASVFEIRYDIRNHSEMRLELLFGIEFVVNLLTGSAPDRYYRSDDRDLGNALLGEAGCDEGLGHLALRDDWQHVECGFRFDKAARIYRFALETVSQSEGGQEKVYQGSVILPCWPLQLDGGEETSRTISVGVERT